MTNIEEVDNLEENTAITTKNMSDELYLLLQKDTTNVNIEASDKFKWLQQVAFF